MINDFTDYKQIAMELKKELGVETHETLKLEKNTKGFNWEIKIFVDKSENDEKALERLENINNMMIGQFEAGVNNDK
jgi:hypothetical protein